MQNKTINNTLLALRKQGGQQGMLAEVLLGMRGVDAPIVQQYHPASRRGTSGTVIEAMKDGPKTAIQIAKAINVKSP